MVRRRLSLALLATGALLAGAPADASGPGTEAPWYLDQFGGPAGDLQRFYDGRIGLVMARAPRPMLYIDWRLLHGQAVGPAAGAALSAPCCGEGWSYADDARAQAGVQGWLRAREAVPGAAPMDRLGTERKGDDYQSAPNCFDDAFDTAAATLKARIAAYGAASPWVKAWLDAQDGVFAACEGPADMPPAPAGAPPWLQKDRAYQEAARALYLGDDAQAADRFAAIAADPESPWRASAPYLRARALTRAVRADPTPEATAAARAAIDALREAPDGTYGRDGAAPLRQVVDFYGDPAGRAAEISRALAAREPPADVASQFRDLSDLADRAPGTIEPLDWMATLKAAPANGPPWSDDAEKRRSEALAARDAARLKALAHAQERWRTRRDPARLLAALSLADPGEASATELTRDGAAVPATDPAWLTIQFHLVRLQLASAPAAELRARLDRILGGDLSISDRNIFTALRLQVAASPAEFTSLALRQRLCAGDDKDGCVRSRWETDDIQPWGVYDQDAPWGVWDGPAGKVGLGEDARAVIDRMPLRQRIALSHDRRLPAALRLDIALTSYARAVALYDDADADALAADLTAMLPQMAADWRRVRATKPGAAKRFAESMVLAKIPGLRTDLVDYTRPIGTVAEFQTHWAPWTVMPKGKPAAGNGPRPLAAYQQGGAGVDPQDPDAVTDLTCLGECGRGAAPLRLPDFVAAQQDEARRERGYFIHTKEIYWGKPPPLPPGAISVWEEMLAYARAHPADPAVPEALHWLVRVGHFGGSHNHSGRRAFKLLHGRYPNNIWARKTPYYND